MESSQAADLAGHPVRGLHQESPTPNCVETLIPASPLKGSGREQGGLISSHRK